MDLGGAALVIVEAVWGGLLDASGNMHGYLFEGGAHGREDGDGGEISDKVECFPDGEMTLAASCSVPLKCFSGYHPSFAVYHTLP